MIEVKNYPGYCITASGQLWSKKSRKYLKGQLNHKGYRLVKLVNSRADQWTVAVHRLVAEYFLKGSFEGAQVNHKDGNKLNNRVDNLEWVTCEQNIRHSWKSGLHTKSRKGSNNSQAKLNEDKVVVIKQRLAAGEGVVQLARDYGVDHSCIWLISRGKTWRHV